MESTVFTSDHFWIEQIADGVYAAVARDGGGAGCNAGIVDLGKETLVLDTFQTPIAAEDLRAATQVLTGRPPRYVVNTHHHPDHWLGNQTFPEAVVVSTHKALENMPGVLERFPMCTGDTAAIKEIIDQERASLETTSNERERAEIERWIARWQYVLQATPGFQPRTPYQTFDGTLALRGSKRQVELMTRGHGHSPGDCFLVLPAERIAFLGDLAFFKCQPYMGDCNPQRWIAQLAWLERSDVLTFVPGHGPLGTKEDVILERQYIAHLRAVVLRAIREGESIESVLDRPLPSPVDAWSPDGRPLAVNVETLFRLLAR